MGSIPVVLGHGEGDVKDRKGPTPAPSVPQTSQDICCVVFAIFNVIWSTLFLEEWKRRGAEFAYKWGTLDTPPESIEEPRPQFRVSPWGGSRALGGFPCPGAGVELSTPCNEPPGLSAENWRIRDTSGGCAGSQQHWGDTGIPWASPPWGGSHAAVFPPPRN